MIKMPDIQSDTFWKRSHFVYELLSCVRLLIFTYSSYSSATISKGFVCGMLDISILPSLHTRSQYCSMCEPTRFIIAMARVDRALITHMLVFTSYSHIKAALLMKSDLKSMQQMLHQPILCSALALQTNMIEVQKPTLRLVGPP